MSEQVLVDKLPPCDFGCGTAVYDGKTFTGPWAYMCEKKFNENGIGLGTGKGQKLVLREES